MRHNSVLVSLAIFSAVCACGAPDLTYRDNTSTLDAGVDAPGDSSDVADTSTDVSSDVDPDTVGDTSKDALEDTAHDVAEDAPQDGPVDVASDADVSGDCSASMVPAPRADGTVFCIDATEVTQQAYASWLAKSPETSSQVSECSTNINFAPNLGACSDSYSPATKPNAPVTCVDWCDAFAYCTAAGKRLCGGLKGAATKYNKHKDPKESQWMRACSAEGTRQYPYDGAYQGTLCNGAAYGAGAPVAVASTECIGGVPGLFDMSGNVGEWENSCEGASAASLCRVRGGSYVDSSNGLRCDTTSDLHRNEASSSVGFRCCGD